VTDLRKEILAEIRRALVVDLEFHGPVELRSELAADLQVDSVGTIVLAVALEDRFRVKLTGTDPSAIASVQDLVNAVEKAVGSERSRDEMQVEAGRPS
jgi:acyl carrier protein